MNANSGIEESNPASPTTKRMIRIEIPSEQANDRTTLSRSTSGATSACSRIARITAITTSARGTMISMSRWFAWSTS